MRIWLYDSVSGELLSEGVADANPVNLDWPLIPAFATATPPPPTGDRQAAVYRDGEWGVLDDWRGVPLWNVATSLPAQIHDLGAVPGEGLTELEPPVGPARFIDGAWVADLLAAQDSAWSRIKAERDRRTTEGGYQVGDWWFHSDTFSRTQQLGLVMLGTAIPAGIQWKTMGGTFAVMTPTLAAQVFAAAAASDMAIFAAAEAHRAAMLASAAPLEYDFSVGWPAVYGE